ncbi:MAG: hypothetical protein M0036_19065 [Desulfobacteraceae bacterium]|nr:hypothetical protein [Desulfobacteraceae bacterium]
MIDVTKDDIKNALTDLHASFGKELFEKTREELETYWVFKFDKKLSLEANLYKFHHMLKLYGNFCRRWEEHKNGSACVVERVRDTYLMPKIREFAKQVRETFI